MTTLVQAKTTAPHILEGQPALIPRDGRRAAVKDMGVPELESSPDDDKEFVRTHNTENADAHRAKDPELKAMFAQLVPDVETVSPDAILAVQDVFRSQLVERGQWCVRIHRADLAAMVDRIIPNLEKVYRDRDANIQKTFDKVARKLNTAGISVETTMAGRMGTNPGAAENQFNFQVRQHADYQQAIALRDQAQQDLLRAKHVARVKAETIDYAVEQLHATVGQMLAGVSLDF